MGQKVSAYVLRLGLNQRWQSNYFPDKKEQSNWLRQDKLIRDYLFSRFPEITQIEIERTKVELFIYVHSPNTSLIAGESNDNLDQILTKITNIVNEKKIITKLYLKEESYTSAQAIANDLAHKLKSRVAWNSLRYDLLRKVAGEREIQGIKILVNGCLEKGGMAQHKKINQGRMPSSTLDSLIEEAETEANTIYGQIGITVQIYKGKRKN
ncbi:MAG: 30S ribosomal protein S3 [Mycoplasmataceae bacterium CE_OT135]|nr:MAG: 30S ribosomal protein S3 [Mycoplasmataceae bacterium CE_OT135]